MESIGELMCCNICFLNFDLDKHKPCCLLPCCHTYCQNCIRELKNQKVCPKCSKQITHFNTNWSLLELVNAKTKSCHNISYNMRSFEKAKELNHKYNELHYSLIEYNQNWLDKLKKQLNDFSRELIDHILSDLTKMNEDIDLVKSKFNEELSRNKQYRKKFKERIKLWENFMNSDLIEKVEINHIQTEIENEIKLFEKNLDLFKHDKLIERIINTSFFKIINFEKNLDIRTTFLKSLSDKFNYNLYTNYVSNTPSPEPDVMFEHKRKIIYLNQPPRYEIPLDAKI